MQVKYIFLASYIKSDPEVQFWLLQFSSFCCRIALVGKISLIVFTAGSR